MDITYKFTNRMIFSSNSLGCNNFLSTNHSIVFIIIEHL